MPADFVGIFALIHSFIKIKIATDSCVGNQSLLTAGLRSIQSLKFIVGAALSVQSYGCRHCVESSGDGDRDHADDHFGIEALIAWFFHVQFGVSFYKCSF